MDWDLLEVGVVDRGLLREGFRGLRSARANAEMLICLALLDEGDQRFK